MYHKIESQINPAKIPFLSPTINYCKDLSFQKKSKIIAGATNFSLCGKQVERRDIKVTSMIMGGLLDYSTTPTTRLKTNSTYFTSRIISVSALGLFYLPE